MQKNESKLTVYFDNPFWVGVYERIADGVLEVCKTTFGAEPKDCEIYELYLNNFYKLSFSPPVKDDVTIEIKTNPKRIQREINKVLGSQGIGTKSQQALKLQHEQTATERKQKAKQNMEEQIRLKFKLRQQKQKEKHRGR